MQDDRQQRTFHLVIYIKLKDFYIYLRITHLGSENWRKMSWENLIWHSDVRNQATPFSSCWVWMVLLLKMMWLQRMGFLLWIALLIKTSFTAVQSQDRSTLPSLNCSTCLSRWVHYLISPRNDHQVKSFYIDNRSWPSIQRNHQNSPIHLRINFRTGSTQISLSKLGRRLFVCTRIYCLSDLQCLRPWYRIWISKKHRLAGGSKTSVLGLFENFWSSSTTRRLLIFPRKSFVISTTPLIR